MRDPTNRRQVLGALGGAFGAIGLAGCTALTSDDGVKDTDGDGVINTEDYAPWDPAVQEKSQLAGESAPSDSDAADGSGTATPTPSESRTVEYGFEDGLQSWEPIWAGPSDCPDQPGLEHETGGNVIEGRGSALFTTECDSNLVTGPTFDVDTSRDFTISVDFYFEDSDSRGLFVTLYGSERTGSEDDRVRAGEYNHQFVRARRKPAKNEQLVSALDTGTVVQQGTIDPGTRHRLVGHKRNGTVSATLDGEPYAEHPVEDATWEPGETYRVALVHSGAWGAPSRIWFDSLSVTHR